MNPSFEKNLVGRGLDESGVPLHCPSCGHREIRTSLTTDKFVYGDGKDAVELTAEVPLRTCTACGFQFLDSEAEDAHHEAVCRHLGVYTPREVRALRSKYGLSRSAFAELTKLGEATIARWERGALIQNGAYDQFLYLLAYEDNLERLRNRLTDEGDASLSGFQSPRKPRFRELKPSRADYERAQNFRLIRAA